MTADLVIGVDSSTQSTKAVAWTREGEDIAEGRAPIAMDMPRPGWVEQDPADWWASTCTALRELTGQVDPARIAGLAVSNQRETIGFLDADLVATRPGMVWLDERALEEIPRLAEALGAERLHAISGKPPDLTPVIYRLAWLRRHDPAALDAVARILDVHGFLTGKLTGAPTASWTSADPSGVFDIEAKAWSEPLLAHLGLDAGRFAPVVPPGAPIGTVTGAAAAATGLAPGTPVFAAGGDGQCAGLGVNAVRPGIVYLNLGTAIITGAHSDTPRIDRAWRTMISPTGRGYFLEGCQRAGTFFVDWIVDRFAGGRGDGSVYARLEAEAAALPLGAEGVTVCPYLSGVMNPHWDPGARASIEGLAPGHGLGHLYRAALEALALESARAVHAMQAQGLAPGRILAVGGGAQSALWVSMFADATGLPVTLSASREASALGAGMVAAVGAGWFGDIDTAATAMSRDSDTRQPDPAARPAWDALASRQAATYRPSTR
ncbi:MAG: FGGY-family carbohydrate kinase [Pseudomonadota bacterium]